MHHASIIVGTPKGINKTIVVLEKIVFSTCKNVIRKKQVQWNLDITKGQGNAKILFCYKEVSLYRSSFSYILLLLGGKRIVQECNAKRLTVGGVGGGGCSTKFYTGSLRPEVQPLTLFIPFLAVLTIF